MRNLILLSLVALVILAAGCESGTDLNPDTTSFLEVFNDETDAEIAENGTITLNTGLLNNSRQLRIMRSVSVDGGAPVVTDVTDDADYNVDNNTIATVSEGGLIEAQAVGSTEVEVVFRDEDGDPSDDDSFTFTVDVEAGV